MGPGKVGFAMEGRGCVLMCYGSVFTEVCLDEGEDLVGLCGNFVCVLSL
jgi:hypothetical protein